MSNTKETTINDFDFNLIGDFFKDLDRQGPGSEEATIKALSFIDMPQKGARMADLGCGTGGQTITVAANTTAHITAIDLMPAFSERMKKEVAEKGLSDRITVLNGSMDDLPFEENSLDVIWCEGAIYHIGYRKGLDLWKRYLKPGGFVAVSEASWFTPERPEEIEAFWMANYDGIDTIPVKVADMQAAGYIPCAHFILPEQCWWNYFDPMPGMYDAFLARHRGNPQAQDMIDGNEREIGLYEKYCKYYGYVFYIGQKPL